jgi:hypothetical protein
VALTAVVKLELFGMGGTLPAWWSSLLCGRPIASRALPSHGRWRHLDLGTTPCISLVIGFLLPPEEIWPTAVRGRARPHSHFEKEAPNILANLV